MVNYDPSENVDLKQRQLETRASLEYHSSPGDDIDMDIWAELYPSFGLQKMLPLLANSHAVAKNNAFVAEEDRGDSATFSSGDIVEAFEPPLSEEGPADASTRPMHNKGNLPKCSALNQQADPEETKTTDKDKTTLGGSESTNSSRSTTRKRKRETFAERKKAYCTNPFLLTNRSLIQNIHNLSRRHGPSL